jgi:LysM repeat protein
MKMKAYILGIALVLTAAAASANPADSIGRRMVDGRNHVVHKIERGETLYGLCREYSVSAEEIKKANPGIESAFNVGREVLIPRKWNGSTAANPVKPTPVTPAPANPTPAVDQPMAGAPATKNTVHTVAPGETLSGIARKYGVTVQQIKEDNNLRTDGVNIGQKLTIKVKSNGTQPIAPVSTEPIQVTGDGNGNGNSGNGTQPRASIKPAENTDPGIPAESNGRSRDADQGTEVNEDVKASIIVREGIDQTRNYLLHPSARVGTIVMLTNPTTNVRVFARVVGNYRNAEMPGIGVQVTQAVRDALASGSSEFNLRLNYAR